MLAFNRRTKKTSTIPILKAITNAAASGYWKIDFLVDKDEVGVRVSIFEVVGYSVLWDLFRSSLES